jgi:hypothetical protein
VPRQPGRHVALVRVAVDVQNLLLRRHLPGAAHALLEHLHRRRVVVGVVELERRPRDRAVVREVRPPADRHVHRLALAAHDLVHAQHVDVGVDRVLVAARVVLHAALAVPHHDPVVVQVRLEAAVDREPDDAR